MNHLKYVYLPLLVLGVLAGTTARAQSISGQISSLAGVPIPGVVVTASRLFPLQRLSAITDTAGNYGFTSGLSGTYTLAPSKAGYTFTPASTNVSVSSGSSIVVNFTAPASVPIASTLSAQGVTATSALLSGYVDSDGAVAATWFEYGLTTSYGSNSSVFNISGAGYVNADLNNLVNGTNYHFRFAASNSFGVTFGGDLSFTTLSGMPLVTTLDPTEPGGTTIKLNGAVNPQGASATAWFEFGTTTNYDNVGVLQNLGSGSSSTSFTQLLIGLSPATTYHCRAVAMSRFATNYGADIAFSATFSDTHVTVTGVYAGSVAWGDYNNDGLPDILLEGYNGNRITQLWRNTGNGFVQNTNAVLPGLADGSLAWGDYDNDGRLDILLTGFDWPDPTTAVAQVWRNNGDGTFTDIHAGLPGVFRSSVAWGDYNNDGRPDILLTGFDRTYTPIAQVWRNVGNGFVLDTNVTLPGVAFSSVAWGDYDNDGRLDILLTGLDVSNHPIAQVWRNTGSGFVNINAGLLGVSGQNNGSSVAWGDYDNDGRLDILLTGYSDSGPISQVWRNTGSGFTNINAGLPGIYDGSAAWGDFDNDVRLDILLSGISSSSYISQVWRNTASGFVNISAVLPPLGYSSAAWGDYDNDGRLDLLLTGYGSYYAAQVWRNNIAATNSPPAAPSGLRMTVSNSVVTFEWNASTDNETPAAGLSYNVRVGTSPGGSDVWSPMSDGNGLRRLPKLGNAEQRLSATLRNAAVGIPYYWSVQAVDSAFAGSAFSSEQTFTLGGLLAPPSGVVVPGDLNGDGIVDQSELNSVLSNYWPDSPWVYMTNTAGLGTSNVVFALTNATSWDFSVLVSTNLMDWDFLGVASPFYYFSDPDATNNQQRYYRLRWP